MVSDLDGFKQINDRFGHLEGNRVLRLFAQALKDSCREYDYVARMGGDEFVVIAPGLRRGCCRKKSRTDAGPGQAGGKRSLRRRNSFTQRGTRPLSGRRQRRQELLAEADRRMYLEKQKQLGLQRSPLPPAMKCRSPSNCNRRREALPCSPTSPTSAWAALRRNQHHSSPRQQDHPGIFHG